MLNPFADVNWHPGTTDVRRFARSLVIGFPLVGAGVVLAAHARHGGWHAAPGLWIGGTGAVCGVVFALAPRLARPFYLAWYFVACCIGLVVGNALLAAIYYVVFSGV